MQEELFTSRPNAHPIIYAYCEPNNTQLAGMLKVGYTSRPIEARMREHYPTLKPGEKPYRVDFIESAVRTDGTSFTDHDIHANLEKNGFFRLRDGDGKKTEWFRCSVDDVRAAWLAVRDRRENEERRTQDFRMRPEQEAAVRVTKEYFDKIDGLGEGKIPRFLWNAKMRFGKTFTTYQLAKAMGAKRVLVLTFKPAVQSAWREDLLTHLDFEGWRFVDRSNVEDFDPDTPDPTVCFGSFQDYLGHDRKTGGIKPRNEWVHLTDWDLVVFDEYHFGAWGENARHLFEADVEDEAFTKPADDRLGKANTGNGLDEEDLPIVAKHYLFLSGTPFKALNSGEFIEEQVYNWTYSDEQARKEEWPKVHPNELNPYESLPKMVMLTYRMPDDIREVAQQGLFDTFSLNAFFEAKGEGDAAEFTMKESVQKWLDLIRGAHLPSSVDDLKLGAEKPPMPFSDTRLLSVLNHTVWYLPRVSSCFAMRNLLLERQNTFFHDYDVIVCAGNQAGIGLEAYRRVQERMQDPLESKTITLTCGKLLTGVTVRPWTGILMLNDQQSAETYFQSAFRVQSPWVVDGDDGAKEIVKPQCYLFDFALDRSLRMVSDYSNQLNNDPTASPEDKVGEFINFLPVLAFDGSTMHEVSAEEILDISLSGTSATLLARRWESALLVNVDNETLRRIIENERAMEALMNIEGFRALGHNVLETIVNKSEAVKKARREKTELTIKEKRELSREEKEFKSKRKQVQEKLMHFATRIPLFMYLTDYREQTLKDVITQLEPGLFRKVTGLTVEDFELLVSLGVFNDALMNDAVWKFRRYEDASLTYTGINRHAGERRGLFDTTLTEFDYLQAAQQESMTPIGVSYDVTVGRKSGLDREGPQKPETRSTARSKTVTTKSSSEAKPTKTTPRKSDPQWKASTPTRGGTIGPHEEPKRQALSKEYEKLQVGDTVTHRKFGKGAIVSIDKTSGFISVDLAGKTRRFVFPDAFRDGFLRV